MILKEIRIKNFRSYYGENVFKLSEGLTLIIGDNGDGKTTFFEALEWLFDTVSNNKDIKNASEKRKSELELGENDEVSVSLLFDHDGEKELIKKFAFQREETYFSTRDYVFHGYFVDGAERQLRDGRWLLENFFSATLRKYCLFKGESELNVFDNDTALNTLVDTFSGVRDYDDYVNLTSRFAEKASNVVIKEKRNDKKNEQAVREYESQLSGIGRQIQDTKNEINRKQEAVDDYTKKLRLLEDNQDLSENYKRIADRIKDKQIQCNKLKAQIDIDYNAKLLDDSWILRAFPSILDEFRMKVQKLSKEKRRQQREDDQRIARQQGRADVLKEIQTSVNDFIPLPWNLPDDAHMQEMIDEEVCKVCGTPAPKGSEAYNFMVKKLNEYLAHIKQEAEKKKQEAEIKPLFKNSFIDELLNRSVQLSGDSQQKIAQIATSINDEIEFVQARTLELEREKKNLQEAEDEKVRLLVQTNGLSETDLQKVFSDYKGISESNNRAAVSLVELKHSLEGLLEQKEQVNQKLLEIEPANNTVKTYQQIQSLLERIYKAFVDAKNDNINKFIHLLEEKANGYLMCLNSKDFHGEVKIIRTMKDNARIALFSSNGTEVYNPSGSQKTTMYMSVLFAISDITTLRRNDDYPLIFDAPTSSFGELKSTDFYNIINRIDKQCIIIAKDLLTFDYKTAEYIIDQNKVNELNCSVYRISKAKGFNPKDLSTIQTLTTKIK